MVALPAPCSALTGKPLTGKEGSAWSTDVHFPPGFPVAFFSCPLFVTQRPASHPIVSRALFWYHSIRDERIRDAPSFQAPSVTPLAPAPFARAAALQPCREKLEGLVHRISEARSQFYEYEKWVNEQIRFSIMWGSRPEKPDKEMLFLVRRRAVILLLHRWVGTLRRAARAQLWLMLQLQKMAGTEGGGLPKRCLDSRQKELDTWMTYSSEQLRYACWLWESRWVSGLQEHRADTAERQKEAQQREAGKDCPVCLEEDLETWQWLPCLHVLCEECTSMILADTKRCPQCARLFQVLGPGD